MAVDVSNFAVSNYIGQPYGQPIATGAKATIPTGPQTCRISIPWAQYGADTNHQQIGVAVNLQAQGNTTPSLDYIRSVYIDNTFVGVPVYVVFLDTLFTVVCPAYSVVCSHVFTNAQQFTIYGDGFQTGDTPTTNLFFSNVDRPGFYIPAAGASGGLPETPVILQYKGTFTAPGGNWTWPNVDFGPEDTDRVIAVCFESVNTSGSGGQNIASVTIGGIAATRQVINSIGGQFVQIWSALVPTGASGSVVVTVNGGAGSLITRGSVYALRNLQSPAPIAANFGGSGSGNATATAALAVQSNGIVLACAVRTIQAGSPNFNWQNVQQNDVGSLVVSGSVTYYGAAGSALTTSAGNDNVSATCNVICAVAWA